MDYDFKIIHKRGKDHNPADYMSQHPLPRGRPTPSLAEEYINFVLQQSTPSQISSEELTSESRQDAMLTMVKGIMRGQRRRHTNNNSRYEPAVSKDNILAFKHVQEELSETGQGILLRVTRIIMPRH